MLATAVAFLVLAVFGPVAQADSPKVILKAFGASGPQGGFFAGATSPAALAVNSTGSGGAGAGDLYVLDGGNRRVQQFSKDGAFIRAWGIDVISNGEESVGFEICSVASECKAAAADSGVAGSVATAPGGIGIDQDTGNIFITHGTQRRVDVFSATGQFEGAIGWGVKAGDTVASGLTFCTTACQTGIPGELGGQFNSSAGTAPAPHGIVVDPRNGHLLVADAAGLRVQEFEPVVALGVVTGVEFVKAFGWDVVASGPENANQIENVLVKASAGRFNLSFGGQTTTDLDYDASAAEVDGALEALPNIGAGNVDVTGGPGDGSGRFPYSITFVGALAGLANGPVSAGSGTPPLTGAVSVPAPMNIGGAAQFEVCTISANCKFGTAGPGAGQMAGGLVGASQNLTELGVDATGAIYVASVQESACNEAEKICRVQKFAPSGRYATEFAEAQLKFTSGNNTGRAQALGVRTSDNHVFVAKHVTGPKYELYEFGESGALLAVSPAKPSEELKNTSTVAASIAVGPDERVYFGSPPGKQIYILIPVPAAGVSAPNCEPPTATSVTCEGIVTIPTLESGGVATSYRFEYSANGVSWGGYPAANIDAGSVPGPRTVGPQTIGPLQPGTQYQVRLCATTASTVCSSAVPVATPPAVPAIGEVYVQRVTKSEATLSAKINPANLSTTYHFEWGPTAAYGNRVPPFERSIGSGSKSVIVQETIAGLQAGTAYHFRVVANNSFGPSLSDDIEFETLNKCGLIAKRCYELVSPADKGPVASVKAQGLAADMQFQAGTAGQDIAYSIASGLPNSTAGTEVLYRGTRTASGWLVSQLSPPALTSSKLRGASSQSSRTRALSDDLSCGVVVSPELLSADAPAFSVEEGGAILYRRAADGTYAAISNLPPSNTKTPGIENLEALEQEEYLVVGMSQDCNRGVFRSRYQYPGIPGAGNTRLYEWNNGVLENVGMVPGPGGPEVAGATPGALGPETGADPGASGTAGNFWRSVSADGSRVIFTALSKAGGDEGRRAVFLREDGGTAVDISQSETATPANGALYQTASKDGSRIFFLANYGLTAVSSPGPGTASCAGTAAPVQCDLYEYNVNAPLGARLRNLSADLSGPDPAGAVVAGVLDTSDDGSRVYFAAQGQLDGSEGKSYAENVSAETFSLYLSDAGAVRFVGTVRRSDLLSPAAGVLISQHSAWASRATPLGSHLLFASSANVTGYAPGGAVEVYRYSLAGDVTECISCRHDELPSVAGSDFAPLASETSGSSNALHPPVSISSDGAELFFLSQNDLATGAVEGQPNLYGWEHNQVFFVATEPVDLFEEMKFAGADSDASDAYFTTPVGLVPADVDGRPDMYDIRVEGGFPPPVAPTPPCDPLAEATCQGPLAPAAGSPVPPPSSLLRGPGNEPVQKAPKKNKTKKTKKKSKKQAGTKQGKRKQGRDANTGRGTAK